MVYLATPSRTADNELQLLKALLQQARRRAERPGPPEAQPRERPPLRHNLPSMVEERQKAYNTSQHQRSERRRREAARAAARARQEAAARASAALYDLKPSHDAARPHLPQVNRRPVRRVTPPLQLTQAIAHGRASDEERAGERRSGQATGHDRGSGRFVAVGASRPTPVGLLAKDFQRFVKLQKMQAHAEGRRRYEEEQRRRDMSEHIIEQHIHAHRRS